MQIISKILRDIDCEKLAFQLVPQKMEESMAINAFNGDSWSIRAAKELLPILIQCAKEERTIYYSEAKELLFKKGIPRAVTVQYGHPAGIVGDALFELSEKKGVNLYPPLNALVIAKDNNLPSVGVD